MENVLIPMKSGYWYGGTHNKKGNLKFNLQFF